MLPLRAVYTKARIWVHIECSVGCLLGQMLKLALGLLFMLCMTSLDPPPISHKSRFNCAKP